ncbi:MAG: redox-sensing transcriptional repressor Rex [Firmicutes bacterium]|jgi:redox-sensing transcriptional repressor|nr:redox-sensing transcriptional repressor Rex [Bacillota bacterium]MBR6503963.1 redox-sensing transcriptional repressor Rex [Bacillota bacterium]
MYSKEKRKVSPSVIRRLPKYRRCLLELKNSGVQRISSRELSRITGLTASQIRQDLNNFGGFGQQGYGYNVEELFEEVGGILGLDKEYTVVMVGFGNLGQAVSNYLQNKEGFELSGIFDVNPSLIGSALCGLKVRDASELEEYLRGNEVDIGIIATDKGSAQSVADVLSAAGVKGIWNFAPLDLVVPENVMLENVHLSDSLYTLAYYISEHEK